MDKKWIIAHRGATEAASENTLQAFEAAMRCRADCTELDVRKTQDGIFVTFHDESIQNIPLNRLPAKEVFRLGLEQGIAIPDFREVLKLTQNKIKLDIELKEAGDEEEIIEMVKKFLRNEDFIITSFIRTSLSRIKKIDRRIRVGLILGDKKSKYSLKTLMAELFPFTCCKNTGIDIIVPHWKLIRFGFLDRSVIHKIPIIVWTVNQRNQIIKYFQDERIAGIITDKPALAYSVLRTESP